MSTTTSTETTRRKNMQISGSVPLLAVPRNAGIKNGIRSSSSDSGVVPGPSTSSTVTTLRSLYPRAAHALLQRDFSLTQALLESAFELLTPPLEVYSAPDALDLHRRKWEILRITLETSAYASPPVGKHVGAEDVLPAPLRANLMLSGPGLITALHSRATRQFTPKLQSPKAAFLPAQILVPLILSSMKLECPEVGRSMIEDWLAQRDSGKSTRADAEGYERVLELYCLHILPRLHEWEFAEEYLEYESELPETVRQRLKSTLKAFRDREIETARTIPSPPPSFSPDLSGTTTPRTPSPSPSTESNSSSDTDDTHSTRTVVPSTRTNRGMNGLAPLTSTSSISSSSAKPLKQANGHALHEERAASPASTVRAGLSRSSRTSAFAGPSQQGSTSSRNLTSITSHAMMSLRLYTAQLGPLRFIFAMLCVLLPVFSFLVRFRRRRRQQSSGQPTTSAGIVRRRLAGQPRGSRLSVVWTEIARAVVDAVRMAGSGLV